MNKYLLITVVVALIALNWILLSCNKSATSKEENQKISIEEAKAPAIDTSLTSAAQTSTTLIDSVNTKEKSKTEHQNTALAETSKKEEETNVINNKKAKEPAKINAVPVKLEDKKFSTPEPPPASTASGAVIKFDETEHNFGLVYEGDKVTYNFNFTNTGKSPLIIYEASSSCGCTVPEAPKEPIPPGFQGTVKVVFDTKGKIAVQNKHITVKTNATTPIHNLYLKGVVDTKKRSDEKSPSSDEKKPEEPK